MFKFNHSTVRVLGIATLAICLIGCGDASPPSDSTDHGSHSHPATMPASQPALQTPANQVTLASPDAAAVNTQCPVTGESVERNGVKVTYKGNTYAFCCDECADTFKSDPDKYAIAH